MPAGVPTVTVRVQPAAKRWTSSRTLIVNAIALALLAAEAQLQLLQPLLPVNVYALAAFVLPVLNAGLRLITTTALCTGQAGATEPTDPAPPEETP